MIIKLTDITTGREIRTIPQAKIHADGTIWQGDTPLLVIGHLPDATKLRAKYTQALTAHIVKECQALLSQSHDVDRADQTNEEIAAKIDAAKRESAQRDADRIQETAALDAMDVPGAALVAYARCNGQPDSIPDTIDNEDYWLVIRYAAAIEHQGLARSVTHTKAKAGLRDQTASGVFGDA